MSGILNFEAPLFCSILYLGLFNFTYISVLLSSH